MKKTGLFFAGAVFLLIVSNLSVVPVFAIEAGQLPGGAGLVPPPVEQIDPALAEEDFRARVLTIVNYFLTFLGLIAIVAVIYFGFLMIIAGGDEEQYTKARKGIIYIGIGIIVILLSYAIVNLFIMAGTAAASSPNVPQSVGSAGFNDRIDRDGAEAELVYQIENIYLDLQEDLYQNEATYNRLGEAFSRLPESLPQTSVTAKVLRHQLTRGILQRKVDAINILFATATTTVADARTKKPEIEEAKALRSLQKDLTIAFRSLADAIDDLPRIEAKITAKPVEGNAPLDVELSGIETKDPSGNTIPLTNYRWSYVDNNGELQDLGSGSTKTPRFESANSYIITLQVESIDPNVLPGVTKKRIEVKPHKTRADFLVNGEEVVTVLNVSDKEARRGIEFDPDPTLAGAGRVIEEYRWDFDGHIEARKSPEKILYPFPETGEPRVVLTVTDGAGDKHKKTITLNIKPNIARIDMRGEALQVGKTITFDGENSSVANANNFRYQWELKDASGTTIANFSDAQFQYVFQKPGEYEMKLTVGSGFTSSETFIITPRPPIPVFTASPISSSEPGIFVFDASASDGAGGSLRYSWDFDGDNVYDIQGATDPIAEHSYTEPGEKRVKLKVADTFGLADQVVRTVRVDSTLNVRIDLAQKAAQPQQELQFRADAPNGETFIWEFGDGSIAAEQQVTHAFEDAGKYTVVLTVTDESGNTNSANTIITIGSGVSPVPVLRPLIENKEQQTQLGLCGTGKDGIHLFRDQLLELDASQSVNIDGTKSGLKYIWDINGAVIDGVRITRKFSEVSRDGNCERISLTITDESSGEQAASNDLFVLVENALPSLTQLVVEPEADPCTTPCRVQLSAIGATDPDGKIEQYRWWAYREGGSEKIGVLSTTSAQTSLSIPAQGTQNDRNTFYFVVELEDDEGDSITSEDIIGRSVNVAIVNQENPKPMVEFEADRTFINTGETVTFSASVRDANGNVMNNASYAWDFDNDQEFDDTFSGATVSHQFREAGINTVRLRIEANGVEASATRTITVSDSQIEYPLTSFVRTAVDGTKVSFDASDSQADPLSDGALTYAWDFDAATDSDGNGIPDDDIDASGAQIEHDFGVAGEYEVILTVTDSDERTAEERQDIDLRTKSAAPEAAITTPLTRSPRLAASVPMANLEVLVRENTSVSGTIFDIMVYGFDIGTVGFSQDATFHLASGEGELLADSAPFVNGHASTQFRSTTPDEPVIIEVSTDALLGTITEIITFLPQSLTSSALQ